MNGSRKNACTGARLLATAVLVVGTLVAGQQSLAQSGNRVTWAPTREEAIVVDGVPSGIPANMLPETALSRSLQSKRPPNLSRQAPSRSQTIFTEVPGTTLPGASESLPAISGRPVSPDGLPVPPEMYYDGEQPIDGMIMDEGFDSSCGPKRCGACRDGCNWIPLCLAIPVPSLKGLEVFGGAQGFTGPANRGGSGSFGFHEGFNWGAPIAGFMAAQFGVNWTESNFSGNYITSDNRNQIFLTAGINRRVDWGFQGGLVFDYLHDEWDYSADLAQLRGELGWVWCGCNEIGFWFAVGVNDASNLLVRRPATNSAGAIFFETSHNTLAVNDLYAFYFRRQFACGGQGRLFAGFTGASQGLLGGDALVPLNPNWSLRSNFTFVTSGGSSTDDPGFARESWNVGISLVWTPCPRTPGCPNYNRPLLNVADNGSFITRLLR